MKSTEFELHAIKTELANYTPQSLSLEASREAAVALVLRQRGKDVDMLFIQRATAEQDPWSGQIAFPGGGKEQSDQDLAETAIRETLEEIGVRLNRDQRYFHLMDQQGSNRGGAIDLLIRCFVFEVSEHVRPVPNYEVAEVFWMPLTQLMDPDNHLTFQPAITNAPAKGVDLGPGTLGQTRILWGLTYRFVQQFFAVLRGMQ